MSWKSVEMQVALPRTQDAGKLQEHMSKQNQHFQESLAQSQLKQTDMKRKTVNENEKIFDAKRENDQHQKKQKNSNRKKQAKQSKLEHPYLGSKIDLSR